MKAWVKLQAAVCCVSVSCCSSNYWNGFLESNCLRIRGCFAFSSSSFDKCFSTVLNACLLLLLASGVSTSDQFLPSFYQQQSSVAMPLEQATFAAGCFWSVELAFQRVPGVVKTTVGYTQGRTKNPRYEEVCSGTTNHVEAVLVEYDPEQVTYEKLLDVFWGKHDPTQYNRQGNDIGTQYRSGIYFYAPEQERIAKESLQAQERRIGKKIVTEVAPAAEFYSAEEYHQQYLEKGGQSAAKRCSDPIRCYG